VARLAPVRRRVAVRARPVVGGAVGEEDDDVLDVGASVGGQLALRLLDRRPYDVDLDPVRSRTSITSGGRDEHGEHAVARLCTSNSSIPTTRAKIVFTGATCSTTTASPVDRAALASGGSLAGGERGPQTDASVLVHVRADSACERGAEMRSPKEGEFQPAMLSGAPGSRAAAEAAGGHLRAPREGR
jgi:hypothetical protein